MRDSCGHAVYNARIFTLEMPIRSLRPLRSAKWLLLLAVASVGLAAPGAEGQSEAGTAEQLAAKVAAVTGHSAVSLEVVNRSSLGPPAVEDVRRALQNAFASAGIRVTSGENTRVRVTLSENLQSYVWIAEIQQADAASTVVMVAQERPADSRGKGESIALTMRKTLLWSQSTPILDVAFWGNNPQRMLVLDPASVTTYRFQANENRWQMEQTLPIVHARPWPRDLRGRFILRPDHAFDAHLPGLLCRSSENVPLAMNCAESDDPWPLYTDPYYLNAFFSPARNFFTGAVSPAIIKNMAAPFFSAAPVPRDTTVNWLVAGLDEQVHLLDGHRDTIAVRTGWGSDIASVHSNCGGSGWQVLASSNSGPSGDFIRAYEVPEREPVAVSPPVVFSGEITVLWASPDYSTAITVSHDVEKETYEAFRLTLACGQ